MSRTEPALDLRRLALSLAPNIGAKTLDSLLRHFGGDLDAILSAPPRDLMAAPGVGDAIAREIRRIDLCRLERDLAAWRANDLRVLTRADGEYPAPLRDLIDPPPALFVKGGFREEWWTRTVAIVGTREPSSAARFIALRLAMQLAEAGMTVVSGLALGIDTAAHVSALTARGITIAVPGSGLLNIYPAANLELARQIRDAGAVVSENLPGCSANAQRLVARNRIISGLADNVVVVESQAEGGAMHTARFAREQGRPVYTFDLPASGNQELMKRGAIVLNRDQPLDELLGNQSARTQLRTFDA